MDPQRRDARACRPDRAAGRERPGRAAGRPARDDRSRRRSLPQSRSAQLGYKVVAKPSGVVVAAVAAKSHAAGKLHLSDLIVAVNGVPTLTVSLLRAQLAKVKPGDVVTLAIDRGAQHLTVRVKTIADTTNKKHAIVGFSPEQAAEIKLPLKVQIDAGNVGGPSAGLAFALEVMEKLGQNVDHGYASPRPARSRSTAPSGRSAASSKRRSACARRRRMSSSCLWDNAADARRYAHGLRIIAVKSFPQALRALATLPPKR